MQKQRIQKVQQKLKQIHAGALLITNPANIFYLTGFRSISPHERESSLLITKTASYFFVPAMSEARAKTCEAIKKNIINLIVDHERDGLLILFNTYIRKNTTVLFEAHDMTVAERKHIIKYTKKTLIAATGIIEELRTIKDSQEITYLKKAIQITDKTFNKLIIFLKNTNYTTLTELDLVDTMRTISRQLGGEGFGFDPIIACGKGSAQPHYQTRTRPLLKNSSLLLDFGIMYKGYTADLTRTIFLGKAPQKFKNIYHIVLACNQKSIQACRPDISVDQLSTIAYDYFKEQKLETYFLHGLGHGVGIEIHERPYLRQGRKAQLKPGMTITIEPGLYFTHRFGIRIEDVVVITQNGSTVLSKSPKKLIEI